MEKKLINQPKREPTGECCGSCKFCVVKQMPDGQLTFNCVRRAPKVTHALMVNQQGQGSWAGTSGWPATTPESWCGEYLLKTLPIQN